MAINLLCGAVKSLEEFSICNFSGLYRIWLLFKELPCHNFIFPCITLPEQLPNMYIRWCPLHCGSLVQPWLLGDTKAEKQEHLGV